uniref:protein BASIC PENTACYSTEINE2-like n=1 Tax=Erigeron canadensis TaxID=72917 RepID=UPI001CB89DFE|nr:protein BASIC PENTACYSTEINE2-like [Erigeron canadensis]
MDDDGFRNWGYYDVSPISPYKDNLGLQLMSPIGDHRDTKPFRESPLMINQNGGGGGMTAGYHHHHHHHQPPVPVPYMRDSWIQRERQLHMQSANPGYEMHHDTSASNSMHIMQSIDSLKDHGMSVEDNVGSDGDVGGDVGGSGSRKKRSMGTTTPKAPRTKKPKKVKENGNPTVQRSKVMKRSMELVINGIDMDISGIPIPVCSCTGTPQQCYRWGMGGWQSACCTTTISMYPLPMSTKRRGARIAGRKMSQGAFKKVLEKLASEGYNFANAIDLRAHWAKHGTNKFVTIR